jgi:hypothetical protein
LIKIENRIKIDEILKITHFSDLAAYVNIVYEIYKINISTKALHRDNLRKLKLDNKEISGYFDCFINSLCDRFEHNI